VKISQNFVAFSEYMNFIRRFGYQKILFHTTFDTKVKNLAAQYLF